jgi:hypothetical protein
MMQSSSLGDTAAGSYRFLLIDASGTVQSIENGNVYSEQAALEHAKSMLESRPGVSAVEIWHSNHLQNRVGPIASGFY